LSSCPRGKCFSLKCMLLKFHCVPFVIFFNCVHYFIASSSP
jgi:hypothetical protein